MQKVKYLMSLPFAGIIAVSAGLLLSGCQTETSPSTAAAVPAAPAAPAMAAPAAPTPPPAPPAPAMPAAEAPAAPAAPAMAASSSAPMAPPVRIKAGSSTNVTDADGNVWLADTGFEEGETVERPDAAIVDSKSPQIYRSEHWGMSSFTYPVPNGKYTVKLHFCETYDGITSPGDRVFGFNVNGADYKDFDVWVKSGGYLHPYVETVNDVNVTDGKIHITFTPKVQNPEINGIEILPAS
jgi:Malectin domain